MLEIISIMLLVMSIANLIMVRKPYEEMNEKQKARFAKQYEAYCKKQAKKGAPSVSEEEFPAVLKSNSKRMLIVSIALITVLETFAFFMVYRYMF